MQKKEKYGYQQQMYSSFSEEVYCKHEIELKGQTKIEKTEWVKI